MTQTAAGTLDACHYQFLHALPDESICLRGSRDYLRPAMTFAYLTGRRKSEALGLQ